MFSVIHGGTELDVINCLLKKNLLICYVNNGKREQVIRSKGTAASTLLVKNSQLLKTQSWQIVDAKDGELGSCSLHLVKLFPQSSFARSEIISL